MPKKEKFLQLVAKLWDIHQSEEACVFLSFNGHVDNFDIRLYRDKGNVYEDKDLYYQLSYVKTDVTEGAFNARIDSIIIEIEDSLNRKQEVLKQRAKEQEESEKKELARLLNKFYPKKVIS